MRARAFGIALLFASAVGSRAAATGVSPIGRWQTEGGWSQVEIYPCGPNLCGRLVWLKEPLTKEGRPKIDDKNPDPAKRVQTLLGLTFMWNFTKAPDSDDWDGGRVYNPLDGGTYRAKLTLHGDGKLELRGYVLVPLFGGSQYWERVQ